MVNERIVMNNKALEPRSILFVFFGIAAGIFSIFSLPTLFVLLLSGCLLSVFRKRCDTPEEKRFITYACGLAIAARIVISLIILGFGKSKGLITDSIGDAGTYEAVGMYIKELLLRVPVKDDLGGVNTQIIIAWLRKTWQGNDMRLLGQYTVPGISYWYAYFYTFLGPSFLATKVLNGILWTVGSFLLYLFFRQRFTRAGIKLGLLMVLFFPSYLIFSSSGLKDSLLFFLVMATVFSVHRLESTNHRWYAFCILLGALVLDKDISHIDVSTVSFFLILVLIISACILAWKGNAWVFYGGVIFSSILLLPMMRSYVHYFVLFFAFCMLFVERVTVRKIIIGSFLVITTASFLVIFRSALVVAFFNRLHAALVSLVSFSALQSYNSAFGNTAYLVYPPDFYANVKALDSVSLVSLFFSFLNGLRYVFFEPTPWTFKSSSAALLFPEALTMFFLSPFIVVGAIFLIRKNLRMALITMIFLFSVTMLLALGQANMGTLVRIRAMVFPWYFMLGAVGLRLAYAYVRRPRGITGGR